MWKIFFAIVAAFLVSLALWAGFSFWENLRGVGPAFLPAPEDIGQVIDETPLGEQNTTDFPLALPDEFSISIFARDLGPARAMVWDPSGVLLVSITKEGKVIALPDKDGDGKADRVGTVVDKLNRPHGVAFRDGKLYIAESDQVGVYEYDAANLQAEKLNKIIELPNGGQHFTRTILFNEEGRLLTSVGSTCNVCVESDWKRAVVLSSKEDGSGLKAFVTGLRNAVFMTLHPVTGEVWATEMGRDLLGDDIPPDEINILREDAFYGWPVCYGKNIHDTRYDKNTYIRNPCQEPFEMPSYIDLQAHSAPLGLAFIPEEGWPEEYWYNLLVAYHGSWNRTVPTGYKIVRFKLDEQGSYIAREDFISGWLTSQGALGRPVDILVQPGGVIYISDDKAGVIYRVVYKGV
jgi:glucose/arabinose dehydrogenase